MTAPVIAPTPGAEVMIPCWVTLVYQGRYALVDFLDLRGQRQREPGLDGDVLGQVGEGEIVGVASGRSRTTQHAAIHVSFCGRGWPRSCACA